jgi:ankyrin repeat protein
MALMKNPYQNKYSNRKDKIAFVNYLLGKGADIKAKDNEGNTVLHYLSLYGSDIPTLKILINNGADVNAKNADANTPLHVAGEYGEKDVFMALMVHGANPQNKNRSGKTPLQLWDETVDQNLRD